MPGNNNYKIEYLPRVISEDIPKLDLKFRSIVQRKIEKLSDNPEMGYPLKDKLSGYYKLKVSKYRIIYKILNNDLIILVIGIGKRDNSFIYKLVTKRISQ